WFGGGLVDRHDRFMAGWSFAWAVLATLGLQRLWAPQRKPFSVWMRVLSVSWVCAWLLLFGVSLWSLRRGGLNVHQELIFFQQLVFLGAGLFVMVQAESSWSWGWCVVWFLLVWVDVGTYNRRSGMRSEIQRKARGAQLLRQLPVRGVGSPRVLNMFDHGPRLASTGLQRRGMEPPMWSHQMQRYRLWLAHVRRHPEHLRQFHVRYVIQSKPGNPWFHQRFTRGTRALRAEFFPVRAGAHAQLYQTIRPELPWIYWVPRAVHVEHWKDFPRAFVRRPLACQVLVESKSQWGRVLPPYDAEHIGPMQQSTEPRLSMPKSACTLKKIPIKVKHLQGHRVELSIQAPRAGWLVFQEGYHRHWQATLDGQRQPIVRANLLFQAIRVPAGTHRVRWVYRCPMRRWGFALWGLTWIALLLGMARGFVVPAWKKVVVTQV
ncbi:MAG: YfhO family protein, partial [Myxococcota bacterium]